MWFPPAPLFATANWHTSLSESFVGVDESQPLPDLVRTAILIEIQTVQRQWDRATSGLDFEKRGVALGRVRLRENELTGKRIIIVLFVKNEAPQPGGYWNIGLMPTNIDLRTQRS